MIPFCWIPFHVDIPWMKQLTKQLIGLQQLVQFIGPIFSIVFKGNAFQQRTAVFPLDKDLIYAGWNVGDRTSASLNCRMLSTLLGMCKFLVASICNLNPYPNWIYKFNMYLKHIKERFCHSSSPISVHHILVDCTALKASRLKYFSEIWHFLWESSFIYLVRMPILSKWRCFKLLT